jgi:hypothetical protein
MIVMNEEIKKMWKEDKLVKYDSIVNPENHNFV